MPSLDTAHVASYYAASLACLRFAEARHPTNRRFGADADAVWESFRGHLTTADRIDLLVRDADAQWRGALAARTTFALPAVADDEPFGIEWPGLDPVDAEELWRRVLRAPPSSDAAVWSAITAEWSLKASAFDVGPIDASARLVVTGPSAVIALAVAFGKQRDLSWSEQVTCIATPPGHRHVALLAAVFLNTTEPGRLLEATAARLTTRVDRVIASPDAAPDDLAFARTHGGV
jgi:hypothetical protein